VGSSPSGASAGERTELEGITATWWVVPEGRGIVKLPDGRIFDGTYERGMPHGPGTAIGVDQSRYEGQFDRGVRHGEGLVTSPGMSARQVAYERGELIVDADMDEVQKRLFEPSTQEASGTGVHTGSCVSADIAVSGVMAEEEAMHHTTNAEKAQQH